MAQQSPSLPRTGARASGGDFGLLRGRGPARSGARPSQDPPRPRAHHDAHGDEERPPEGTRIAARRAARARQARRASREPCGFLGPHAETEARHGALSEARRRDSRGTRDASARRRRDQERIPPRTHGSAPSARPYGELPDRSRRARKEGHGHRDPSRRIQPRAGLLHRSLEGAVGERSRALHAQTNPQEHRTLHHGGTQGLRRQGDLGEGTKRRFGKGPLRPPRRGTCRLRRRPDGSRPRGGGARRLRGARRSRPALPLGRPGTLGASDRQNRQGPPPGRRDGDRNLRAGRLRDGRRTALPHHYRPEHGR